jgi:RNA polymerase sigma-70 factor (ECF subfamily)
MDPMTQAEGSDRADAVRKALARLTAEQQHVLTLRFGDGYSLQETAEIMKKKTNAIKALQFRALAALRRGVGEETP